MSLAAASWLPLATCWSNNVTSADWASTPDLPVRGVRKRLSIVPSKLLRRNCALPIHLSLLSPLRQKRRVSSIEKPNQLSTLAHSKAARGPGWVLKIRYSMWRCSMYFIAREARTRWGIVAAVVLLSLFAAATAFAQQEIVGGGTTNYIPVFTGSNRIGNSHIAQLGGSTSIGATNERMGTTFQVITDSTALAQPGQ